MIKLNLHSNPEIKNKYNMGLGLLKVILALDVIISHNFNRNSTNNKILLLYLKRRRVHVPSFFIMSFYFTHKDLVCLNINKIKKRFERLIIPYVFWTLIIWLLNNLIKLIFKGIEIPCSIKDLKNQLLWGNIFIIQFWFLWDIIIINLIFIIIIFLFKDNNLFYFQLLGILAYILQYSGINRKLYLYLSFEKRECLSRLSEMIPYSVTGYTLAFFKVFEKLQKNKFKVFFLSLIIFIIIDKYEIFSKIEGVAYSGIKLNAHSICLIFLFSVFPQEKIKNKVIINFLLNISKYTAGVFYLHWSIICYLRNCILAIQEGSFIGCIIVYLIAYMICFIGIKINDKNIFKYLFS